MQAGAARGVSRSPGARWMGPPFQRRSLAAIVVLEGGDRRTSSPDDGTERQATEEEVWTSLSAVARRLPWEPQT
jgi:hypothetical protein